MRLIILAAIANLLSIYSDGRVFTQTVRDMKTCEDAVFVFDHDGRTRAEELAYRQGIADWRAKHPCSIWWTRDVDLNRSTWNGETGHFTKIVYLKTRTQHMLCTRPGNEDDLRYFRRHQKDSWETDGSISLDMWHTFPINDQAVPPAYVTKMKCTAP